MNFVTGLRDYIVDNFLFGEGENFSNDTPLFESGILDSTGAMELVCFIEETYNTTIEDEELTLENFQNLNSINFLLNKKLSYMTS